MTTGKQQRNSANLQPRHPRNGSQVVEVGIGDGVTAKVAGGGGGTVSRLSPEHARAIQRFANERGVQVYVVGSRASGNITSISDFDYIVVKADGSPINSQLRQKAMRDLPRGPRVERELGRRNGIDIIKGVPLDPERPHITFGPTNE